MDIKDAMIQQPLMPLRGDKGEPKTAFPKTLDLAGEPEDSLDVSAQKGARQSAPVEPEETEEKTTWRDVASTALLLVGTVTGSLTGAHGSIALTAQAAPPPTYIERVIDQNQASAPRSAERVPVHIISHIDASEHIIEPFATSEMQQLEQIKAAHKDDVIIDATVVRDTGDPYAKLGTGGIEAGITLAPGIAGYIISRKKSGAVALLALGVGGALSFGLAKTGLGTEALRNIVSGASDLASGEPVWNGTRVYEVQPDTSKAIDSKLVAQRDALKPDAQQATDFFVSQMRAHPNSTTVVHMVGHGLGYHASSGFDFKDYDKILHSTLKETGKPIDLLLVESCLEGNSEAVMGSFPSARYVVVSEESIAAQRLPDVLKRSLDEVLKENPQDGDGVDPRKLGEAIIRNSKDVKGIETISLIDMTKVTGLKQSIDEFGKVLGTEVAAGRDAGIGAAIKNTQMYPAGSVEGDMGQKLGMGDLKQFAENILHEYGETSVGKGDVDSASASSPQATQVKEAARRVLNSLDESVVAVTNSSSYQGAGGLSVQLPVGTLKKVEQKLAENKMTTFKDSEAPQGWKDFVFTMSDKLAKNELSTYTAKNINAMPLR
jgi:hypothetical protein